MQVKISRALDYGRMVSIAAAAVFFICSFWTKAQDAPDPRVFGMGPVVTPEQVQKAVQNTPDIPQGPFQPTWESIRENYKVPQWFRDGKFGIFLHWGLYSVPAFHNEWYQKHMYGNSAIQQWHVQNYGPVDKFGYKDFIPMFTVPRFDPDEWADLFKEAGAAYVIPSAEHHDWFSLWDSEVTPWNAGKMGPRKDLIGLLAKAVRSRGMKFGVSNHSIEHYTFIQPLRDIPNDLDDPAYRDFYWVTNHSDENLVKFLELWLLKNFELIDKYQVDMLWFDNGINHRYYDPLKLKVAAYYYNRAAQWGKEVSISAKSDAFLAGSIMDYERQGRAPKELTDFVWQPDDPIGPTFGYTTEDRGRGSRTKDMAVGSPSSFVTRLIQNVSRNGNYLLNISPRGDGSIPENQQKVLREIGQWLKLNGESIYGTRPWIISEEGSVHFTAKGNMLYAIFLFWPEQPYMIKALSKKAGIINSVQLIGCPESLSFIQDEKGLQISFPAEKPCKYAYVLKINGVTIEKSGGK